MELGNRLKELRKNNNINQDELAEKLFVSRQTISNWENDKSYLSYKSQVTVLSDVLASNETLQSFPISIPYFSMRLSQFRSRQRCSEDPQ